MYTERFSLGFVAGVLMAAAERRRPGLGPWSPAVRAQLEQAFRDELEPIRRSFFELFTDTAYWERLEKALFAESFPRYAALAEKATALEQRDYGLWRGGDLLARLAYAGGGLVVGALCVKIPWIPIPPTWDLFAFVTMLAGPFIPDAQVWWFKRRHDKSLQGVMQELSAAQQTQQLYQPLDPLQLEARPSPIAEVGASTQDTEARLKEPGEH